MVVYLNVNEGFQKKQKVKQSPWFTGFLPIITRCLWDMRIAHTWENSQILKKIYILSFIPKKKKKKKVCMEKKTINVGVIRKMKKKIKMSLFSIKLRKPKGRWRKILGLSLNLLFKHYSFEYVLYKP